MRVSFGFFETEPSFRRIGHRLPGQKHSISSMKSISLHCTFAAYNANLEKMQIHSKSLQTADYSLHWTLQWNVCLYEIFSTLFKSTRIEARTAAKIFYSRASALWTIPVIAAFSNATIFELPFRSVSLSLFPLNHLTIRLPQHNFKFRCRKFSSPGFDQASFGSASNVLDKVELFSLF